MEGFGFIINIHEFNDSLYKNEITIIYINTKKIIEKPQSKYIIKNEFKINQIIMHRIILFSKGKYISKL